MKTWQDSLFEIIRLGDGFVACKGGTGTLAELAVAWEMMNKSVMPAKPFVALGEFWTPDFELCAWSGSRAGKSLGRSAGADFENRGHAGRGRGVFVE